MWVRKQELEPYVEQLMDSKLIKKYVKAVYYHPLCFVFVIRTLTIRFDLLESVQYSILTISSILYSRSLELIHFV